MALPSATAAPYSYEVDGAFSRADSRFSESDVRGINGSYFFRPVAVAGAPLAEAAFAGRASSMSLGLARSSLEVNAIATTFDPQLIAGVSPPPIGPNYVPFVFAAPPPAGLAPDRDTYRAAGRYVHDSGWLAEAGLEIGRSDQRSSFGRQDSDSTDFFLSVGKYFLATTTVTLQYERRNTDSASSIDVCVAVPCTATTTLSSSTDDTTDLWSARVRHLIEAASSHHAVAASISYATQTVEGDSSAVPVAGIARRPVFEDKTYFARADVSYTFYPRTDVGLGLGLARTDAERGSDSAFSLFANWFVTERVGLEGRYSEQGDALTIADTDVWEFRITGRF